MKTLATRTSELATESKVFDPAERVNSPFDRYIIGPEDRILVTGASGFIGGKVVEHLLSLGFRNLCCLTRSSAKEIRTKTLTARSESAPRVEVKRGNLLSREDCAEAVKDAKLIIHLAAGRGEKSYPDAFLNSVVTTRNLLDATVKEGCLKRFVNISSFAVYSNAKKTPRVLDESSPIESNPEQRGEAYCYAKVRQDEIVTDYSKKYGIPYVIVRPGYVFGPGKKDISGRVGIDTFGFFIHLGGGNSIPFTYIDNCAEAIALAGIVKGVEGEVFNIIDDDLPSSRQFLRLYKRNVRHFKSIYLPHFLSYAFCYLWERYSSWSAEQMPPAFTRGKWYAHWKKTRYSNQKIKTMLGWKPAVPMAEGLKRYMQACLNGNEHA